jgi:hypothetical protein
VFEPKTSWRLIEPLEQAVQEAPNYSTLREHIDAVRAQFRAEQELGWMLELSDEEAHSRFGKNLFLGSLAVLEERDKLRVLHDGSHQVLVNHRIRPPDQQRMPGPPEVRTILERSVVTGHRLFGVKADVSKAHRRVKVHPSEWGMQACRIEAGRVWVNCVGTFGMGSAAYWWGRLGACLVRLAHYTHRRAGDLALRR